MDNKQPILKTELANDILRKLPSAALVMEESGQVTWCNETLMRIIKANAADVGAAERFQAMLRRRRAWAEACDLDPDMIETLYRDMVNHFIQQEMTHWRQER